MVRSTIQTHNENIPYKPVVASRGKVIRAGPISSLYDLNRIHHVGHFSELEDQMCSMLQSGYIGLKSPDRVDAAIWGLTELFPGIVKKEEHEWKQPQVKSQNRSASRYERRI
jgi:phage terminase large subunit-like protein